MSWCNTTCAGVYRLGYNIGRIQDWWARRGGEGGASCEMSGGEGRGGKGGASCEMSGGEGRGGASRLVGGTK